MKNSKQKQCYVLALRYYLYIIAITLFYVTPQISFGQCVAIKGSLEGIVFADINNNGIRNVDEVGVSNVLVQAYGQDGNLISSTPSSSDGSYSFQNLKDGELVRLIFNYQDKYSSSFTGSNNGSSVQFVQVPACNIGFGLIADSDMCNSETEIVTTCFVQGSTLVNQDEPTIVGIKYGFNSASGPRKLASHGETGSIWGLAWKNSTKEIFSSAFVKQYSGLTTNGHDAIYRTIPSNGGFQTSLFAKLSNLGQTVGSLTTTDVTDCNYGAQVGKIGLGAIVASQDEKYLYTVNLYNNTLVRIPTIAPTSTNTVSYQIPDPGCSDGKYSAFALKFHEDKLYVGVTCTAEITKKENASSANVYEFNILTGQFKLVFTTNYIKGYWQDSPADALGQSHWLTDIDFTDDGNMLIGLTDRLGHRYCKASTNRLDEQKPDLLMVWNNGGVWELENNGKAGSLTGTGVGNTQGPGGGEFFGDDHWVANPLYHSEIAIGSIFVMPGTNSVVAAVFDPEVNAYSGGLHRYNTQTGTKEGSKELYTRNINIAFGKATGFGEIIATCGLPDIEIGNLVWNDADGNGIQDAAEKGIINLKINLYNVNCELIGSTITDAKGNYYFNNGNVSVGIQRFTTYYIGIDAQHYDQKAKAYNIGNNLYNLTKHSNGSPLIDSNILDEEMDCPNTLIDVSVSKTGHDFDLGLVPARGCDLKLKMNLVSDRGYTVNDVVIFEIEVSNDGGTLINNATIEDILPSAYVFVPELNSSWTEVDGKITLKLDEILEPGEKITRNISLKFRKNQINPDYLNIAKVISITDAHLVENTDITSCFIKAEDAEAKATPIICDLALLHKVSKQKVYTAGSEVTFITTVCNQGTVNAANFEITNFLNDDLDFDPKGNIGWVITQDLSMVKFVENNVLAPKTCRDYTITYTIFTGSEATQIINYSEISVGTCQGMASGIDFDSTPDDILGNDIDEDDQDSAVVPIDLIDVSLLKSIDKRRAYPGELITFNLSITNEGRVPISRVDLVDYVPANTSLEDSEWTMVNNYAEKSIKIEGNLQPGQTVTTQISLRIHQNVKMPITIFNTAEIHRIYDQFDRDVSYFDIDSTPDAIIDNDIKGLNPGDNEDDISSAFVVLFADPSVTSCSGCRAATTPSNGQFEVLLMIESLEGEGWFVESSVGLYDFSSPFPPATPILLADGFLLTEVINPNPGYKYYRLNAVHLDGQGYSLRLRNKFGDLEQVEGPSTICSFQKLNLTGDQSLCLAGTAIYTASNAQVGSDYVWKIDGNTIAGQSSALLNVNWSAYGSGSHIVSVESIGGCRAPASLNVSIGQADGSAIACIGNFNVSLDGTCSIVIHPSMMVAGNLNPNSPYSVMLTDKNGIIIPNATLTSQHIGTKVSAKLIEGCGGNTCWSTITVEDKIAPTSICRDITLPCYKLDEYEGPFEADNCGGPVTNIIVSENITPLTCNDSYVKYIDRIYQATDKYGNKSKLCSMRISVERPNFEFLKFPNSLTMVNDSVLICSSFEKDELGRPSTKVTGVPTIAGIPIFPSFASICNISAGYTDVEFGNIGCTKKIIRSWVVYEQWCSNGRVRNFNQVIEITDTIPPVISAIQNMVVTTNSHSICEATVTLPLASVKDSCNSPIKVDITYPGGFISNQTAPNAVNLPVGTHAITYTAYDVCQNSSQISFTVKVEDKTAPTAICKGIVVVGLNSLGEAYLLPNNLNDGSFDGCGLDSMKVAKMTPSGLIPDIDFKKEVSFNCKDVGKSIMVALRVWDVNGNSNSCMATVQVQDKHAPQITCPAPVTIDCSDVFTGMDLTKYGTAVAIDACGATVVESAPVFKLNSCRVGTIERTFIASDSTASVSCTQIITVGNKNYFDPIRDVTKSEDFEVNNHCGVDDLKPENLTGLRGYPTIRQTNCSLAAASYKDDVYTFVTGACYKILRNWTIIDWCEMDRLGSAYVPFTFQQTIKVNNTEPPFFVGAIIDTTFFTPDSNCLNAPVYLKVTGRDSCTADNLLRWTYKFDKYNDGKDIVTNTGFGNMAIFNAIVEVGYHKIQWIFEDACGNIVTKDQFFTVRNNTKPQAGGLESVSIAIVPWDSNGDGVPDIEKACIVAASLNASSSSLCCTTPLHFSFSADINDTLRCFNCVHVGRDIKVELWVHDCNGNTDKVTVKIDVQDNNDSDICETICIENSPTPAITGTNIICNGTSTTLTASGGTEYTWNTGATTASIIVGPSVNSIYTVTVTNDLGCSATASQSVTVRQLPNVQIAGNNICIGGSTNLTASGGSTYLWNTGATTAVISVSPVTSTTYTVTATGSNGCIASISKEVLVNTLPIVSVSGIDTVCMNKPTTLTASGAIQYLWSTGATTTSITVSPSTTTTYTVTGINGSNCTGIASKTVTVNPLPTITIVGNNSICPSGSTTLTASGGSTYSWSTNATTAIINVTPVATTTYTVTATDANGCTNTANRTVTVNPTPNASISGNNAICIGASTILTASGGGTYKWSNNETTAAITVSPAANTTYTVTVTNTFGCTNTANRTVTINPTVIVNIEGDSLICNGETTVITASGGVSYAWNTGVTTASLTVSPLVTTTYTVIVTANNGCTGTLARTVTVNPKPIIVISGDKDICLGESTTLTASGGQSYLWSNNATTASITVSPTSNTTYSVTVTDVNLCSNSTNAVVTVDPGTLTCTTQDIMVFLGPNGSVMISPSSISTGSTGACINFTASVFPNEFFCNDIGPNTVTLTVVNTNNNQSLTCTAIVTVKDTIIPQLLCPANVIVNCDDFDPNTPLSSFGMATVTDNCANNVNIDTLSIVNLNSCNVGLITRTFTATDNSGNTSQCVQLISIVNNNPVSLANISFPVDTTVSNCSNLGTDVLGSPTVNIANADCSNISISFVDNSLGNPVCADTLIRTWTVIDSCQLQVGTNNGIFVHAQNIFIIVNAPVITGPIDTSLVVNSVTCDAAFAGVFHSVSGCNLELSNDINALPSFDLTGNYPVGVTSVTLTAVETCSNLTATYTFQIEVTDTTTTRLKCRKQFPAILDNDPPSVEDHVINHAIIEIGCNDNLMIVPSYSGTDINDTVRTYFCSDINQDFPITVHFWSNGVVIQTCNSLATPVDLSSNSFCTGGRFTVGGNVKTETDQIVKGVNVSLDGSDMADIMSDDNGKYHFPLMNPGGEYKVVPSRNVNPTEGVSTLDLIHIQKHILGTAILGSPYKIIAADVNKDNKVTASDIVELRKLILGLYDNFPTNTSWRMVDANYIFPNPLNPFLAPFPENYFIGNLNANMAIDWIGVKTGDVNNSFVSSAKDGTLLSRANGFNFEVEDVVLDKGFNSLPVVASKDETLTGFQIVLKLRNANNVTLTSDKLKIGEYNYSFTNEHLVISWNDATGVFVEEGEELFRINWDAANSVKTSDFITRQNTLLSAEYYTPGNEANNLELRYIKNSEEQFVVWGNNPNPWNNETNISFYLPKNGDVSLRVRDVTGRIVYTKKSQFTRGNHVINLTKDQIQTSGILLYDLTFDNEVKTFKMLIIK